MTSVFEHLQEQPLIILFLLLLLTCIMKEFEKHSGFPLILSLLFSGMLVGFFSHKVEMMNDISQGWKDFSVNLVYSLLYPAGIFISTYLVDFHLFRKEMLKIFLLATVGQWTNLVIIRFILGILQVDPNFHNIELWLLAACLNPISPSLLLTWINSENVPFKFQFLIRGENIFMGSIGFFTWKHIKLLVWNNMELTNWTITKNFFNNFTGGLLFGTVVGFVMSIIQRNRQTQNKLKSVS